MARRIIPKQKKKYQELNKRLNKYSMLVQSLYERIAASLASTAARSNYIGEKPISLRDYPDIKKSLDEAQIVFAQEMQAVIMRGTSAEWKESNLVQDLLADGALKMYKGLISGEKAEIYYQTNSDALKAFQSRKQRGLNLSQMIWNQSAEMQDEMLHCLSASIEKGISAVTLSKRMSKYLVDFDKLKNDYKERYGKAVTCKDCEYRSMRLVRSEINMAYRTAEQMRWQQMDFIVGYEIKTTSNPNHVSDICDLLAGKYPLSFKWTGWHPNCRCYTVPILKKEEDFWKDDSDVERINDVPENFKDWAVNNRDRIAESTKNGTVPYFVKDNKDFLPHF